jgi:hypothetical protein
MTDKLQERLNRGHRAKELLGDALMVEAKAHIESELYRLFSEAVPTDIEALQQIKGMQYMHTKYLAFFQSAITDGKIARIELDSRKKPGALDRLFNR